MNVNITNPPPDRPKRGPLRRFLFVLFLFYLLFGAVDLYLEASQQFPPPTRLPSAFAQAESELTKVESRILQFRPGLLWELRPGARMELLEINEDGFHGTVVPKQRGQAPRIAVLSDGCGFGVGRDLNRDEAWPRNLETALLQKNVTIEVVNLSVPCYSSAQMLELYKTRGLEWGADICIICASGFNDSNPSIPGRSDAEEMQRSRSFAYRFARAADGFGTLRYFRESWFTNSLLTAAPRELVEQKIAVPRVSPAEFETNLKEIVKLQKESGGLSIILAPPIQNAVFERRPVIADYIFARERAAAESGASLVDAHKAMKLEGEARPGHASRAESEFLLDLYHPTATGHWFIANALAGEIIQKGMLRNARAGRR